MHANIAKILDYYENPRNIGSMNADDPDVGIGLVGSPQQRVVVKLSMRVNKNDIIVDAKFKTYGCEIAIASASYTTEIIKGMTISQALAIKNTDIVLALDLPHGFILVEDAIQAAIANYQSKHNGE